MTPIRKFNKKELWCSLLPFLWDYIDYKEPFNYDTVYSTLREYIEKINFTVSDIMPIIHKEVSELKNSQDISPTLKTGILRKYSDLINYCYCQGLNKSIKLIVKDLNNE